MAIAITSNWQLHVPLAARKAVGLDKPGIVALTVKKGELIIKPRKSKILSLAGDLNYLYKKRPLDVDNIRNDIDYSAA